MLTRKTIALGLFALIAGCFLFGEVFVANWMPFILLLPPSEHLHDEATESSCEFPNLAPQSDVIVLAESDHDQWEHFATPSVAYGFPWRRPELTLRFVQQVRVQAVILGDKNLEGQKISFFHHMETRGMVGCSLRQGILLKGYYLIFLKRTESDQFRLARDRLTATLDLREGDYAGLRPRGASAETRVLSILFDQARRQSDDSQARELLQKAFNLIHQWKLESENLGFWEEWTGHGNTRNTEFACDSDFAVYWWAVDACAETVRGRDSESLRRNQMSWDQQQQDWKRDPSAWRARTMAGQNTLNRVP